MVSKAFKNRCYGVSIYYPVAIFKTVFCQVAVSSITEHLQKIVVDVWAYTHSA